MFKTYDEPESPNDGACLIYMMNRTRQIRGPYLTHIYQQKERNTPGRAKILTHGHLDFPASTSRYAVVGFRKKTAGKPSTWNVCYPASSVFCSQNRNSFFDS